MIFIVLGTGDDNFAGNKDKHDNLGLENPIYEPRKTLRIVRGTPRRLAERMKSLKPDRKFDIAGCHDVLNLEILELCRNPYFLDDSGVLPRRNFRLLFAFGAGDDHLARGEDESGGSGFPDSHYDGLKAVGIVL